MADCTVEATPPQMTPPRYTIYPPHPSINQHTNAYEEQGKEEDARPSHFVFEDVSPKRELAPSATETVICSAILAKQRRPIVVLLSIFHTTFAVRHSCVENI